MLKHQENDIAAIWQRTPVIRYSGGTLDGALINEIGDEMLQQLIAETELSVMDIKNQLTEAELEAPAIHPGEESERLNLFSHDAGH
jgi:hypothetical protein